MIALLDYGAGNVRSVINAIESLGKNVTVVSSAEDILRADKLVFPGVGAFGNMMRILREKGYDRPLKEYLASDKPFLGICLGLQALFEASDEAPDEKGLGVLPGCVKRFDTNLSVPHIGWNGIRIKQASPLFNGLDGNERFYFVHSYLWLFLRQRHSQGQHQRHPVPS
jgi:glutamine amidotransferase/cyclase